MMKQSMKRDQWEDMIRSKLRDFEVDTEPDDWKAIADRLPGKMINLSRRWYYAAAAIAMFLLISIGYYYFDSSNDVSIVADMIDTDIPEQITEQPPIKMPESDFTVQTEQSEQPVQVRIDRQTLQVSPEKENKEPEKTLSAAALLSVAHKPQIAVKHNYSIPEIKQLVDQALRENKKINHKDYLADATKSGRRWGIGAGGGSYSIGTTGVGLANDIRLRSYLMGDPELSINSPEKRDDYLDELLYNTSNSEYNTTSIKKVGLTHKQPISFGIGIGYALSDRWSLQSGLVYTLLSSEWRTELDYQGKFKQQLHFIGVPLGISYKIAEWNKLRFYTTAGGMAEWNIAGNTKTSSYSIEGDQLTQKEAVRMKETQWSVNARVGATCPVIKYINAYVEGGANYYFDNKSSIETVRSNKPFQLSLQAGLRLGF